MKSIRKQLNSRIIRYIIIICLEFTLITSLGFFIVLQQNMKNNVNQISQGYIEGVQNQIELLKSKAEYIATDPRITDDKSTLAEKKDVLKQLAAQYGFNDISVSDANGKTYNNTDISDRDYFKAAMNGENYVSSPVVRKTDSSVILFVAAKIDNGTDYDGIIYASLSSDEFSKIVSNISIGNNGYGYIMDKTGTIIADKDQSKVDNFLNYITDYQQNGKNKDLADLTQKIISNNNGVATFFNKGLYYMNYQKIDGTDGWSLNIKADYVEMMKGDIIIIIITLLLFIGNIIVGKKMVKSIAGPIAEPIEIIEERIKLLSQGDLKTKVPEIKSDNETKSLADSLQKTIDNVNIYIEDIEKRLEEISHGNLDINFDVTYEGDFAPIETSMKLIANELNLVVKNISQSAELVASTSEEISATTQTLSEGSTDQAGVVEELFASFNEVADKVGNTAQNTKKADEFVEHTKEMVNEGNIKMQTLLKSMEDINNASSQIKEITESIKEIADQTNLLALNAAIEAARAGESGKGFAVVAEEVRVLAEQSSKAVEDTAAIIEKSIIAAQNGSVLAKNTSDYLGNIVQNVNQVAEIIEDISKASDDQSVSINQMTEGVEQISEVVTTNSATAEETAAASQELASQAQLLKQEIDKFQLKEE